MRDASGGVLRRMGGCRRVLVLTMLAAVCPVMLNCYGGFPLTKAVYNLNGSVPTGILKNVVFWVFTIAPVYSTAALVDMVVLNLIEFWTGGAVDLASTVDESGTGLVFEPSPDGGEAILTVWRDGEETGRLRFVRTSDARCEVHDASGEFAGSATVTPAGDLRLFDKHGRLVSVVPGEHLKAITGT